MTQRSLDCTHLPSPFPWTSYAASCRESRTHLKRKGTRFIPQEPPAVQLRRDNNQLIPGPCMSMVHVSPSSPTPAKVAPVTPAAHEWRVRVDLGAGPARGHANFLRCLTRARTNGVRVQHYCGVVRLHRPRP
jgi:hypothetical protein